MSSLYRRATASLAMMGFTLASIAPQTVRASSGSSSSSSPSSSSLGSSSGASVSLTVATVVLSVSATAAVVIAVVVVSNNHRKRREAESAGQPSREQLRLMKTRELIDSGLLTMRGDLGMELALLVESPRAWDQVDDEVARGSGPGFDALIQATGLPAPTLTKHWQEASKAAGAISDRDQALRFVYDFVGRTAEDLPVRSATSSRFLWDLERERASASFPEGDLHAHQWMASWLGVPNEAVIEASNQVLGSLQPTDAGARGQVYTDPDAYVEQLAAALAASQGEQIDARFDKLVEQVRPWLPPSAAPDVEYLTQLTTP